MTQELTALTLAALLQVVQFVIMAVPANIQLGPAKTTGPRDQPLELHGLAGRLKRAQDNHFEGLILFSIAVMVITVSDQSSAVTVTSAWAYLVARILYVPAYVIAVGMWRSAIWGLGFLATIVMLCAALV
ncbi:MAPEG family protein [Alterinioella nitratireducens]|uniref:MAPEG family protein n=1 Tax=Alterinioella nitratireducens TaxID=2735915 RepID=UPI001552DDF1|nr:MAPEG family protein [Alterinioella nitratireducens]NPD19368.1 MAPEG family protein [Alterinioella nitratireducens]